MKASWTSSCILLSALLLPWCASSCRSTENAAWTAEDSWYTGGPADTTYQSWPELDRARIHLVREDRQPEAEQLLEAVPTLQVTSELAAELAGEPLPEVPGTRPYLVRGVCLGPGTSGWSVHISGEQLVVHHGTLGSGGQQMRRQALVLQLESEPARVFVTCSMAK